MNAPWYTWLGIGVIAVAGAAWAAFRWVVTRLVPREIDRQRKRDIEAWPDREDDSLCPTL